MTKTTLVFVSNDLEAIAKAKTSFVEFLGMRMISDTLAGTSVLELNQQLDSYDMNQLSRFIPENMTILCVNSDESFSLSSQNYCYLQA